MCVCVIIFCKALNEIQPGERGTGVSDWPGRNFVHMYKKTSVMEFHLPTCLYMQMRWNGFRREE